jgi:23S rRNA (adenine2503-C2)-methyltransferase
LDACTPKIGLSTDNELLNLKTAAKDLVCLDRTYGKIIECNQLLSCQPRDSRRISQLNECRLPKIAGYKMMEIIEKKIWYPLELKEANCADEKEPTRDIKVRLRLDDGNIIEASVFSRRSSPNIENKIEKHACISTHAGCKFNCKFCLSGRNGFKRDLTYKEILNEIELLLHEEGLERFDYIMYMGIGEPLDNFNNVTKSIAYLQDNDNYYNNRIRLATCGIADKLVELANHSINIDSLWVSLHAADNEKRSRIMPVNKKFPIENIINSAEIYAIRKNKIVWLNYLVYEGFNNSDSDAQEISQLLNGRERTLGLMLTIPSHDFLTHKKSNYKDIEFFINNIQKYGVRNSIRILEMAETSIGGGCGDFIFTPNEVYIAANSVKQCLENCCVG